MIQPTTPRSAPATATLLEAYRRVRRFTVDLCEPLEPEDCVIQSMPEASPTRWHLAHTTWFFEAFILAPAVADYRPHHPEFHHLFNSYYNTLGEPFARPNRGLLSRPTLAEILDYRQGVDRAMEAFLEGVDASDHETLLKTIEIGIHHEQQHQELILTDIKHVLAQNPLCPVYRSTPASPGKSSASLPSLHWFSFEGGLEWIGYDFRDFGYDNEGPRHREFVEPFALAARLVTCEEYLEFMEDGGYTRPELWLSPGWDRVLETGWDAPLYWRKIDGVWSIFTLAGRRPLHLFEPVSHVSYYEADAFARWRGVRLPTEAEWEVAARPLPVEGNFSESGVFHPRPAAESAGSLQQVFGDVWEWTASPYTAYPGYRPPRGSLGEYNGKFMCNQMVLRGGSCASSREHLRATYRNFFAPDARWQFSGIRLAR